MSRARRSAMFAGIALVLVAVRVPQPPHPPADAKPGVSGDRSQPASSDASPAAPITL
jgi:hypothetical protein